MIEKNYTLQSRYIVGILRVIAGHLELQYATAGNLCPLKGQLQAIHIVCQFSIGKLAV